MKNFDLVGQIDVQPVLEALGDAPVWDGYFKANPVRQATKGSPHTDTETIFLRMPPVIDIVTIFYSMEVVDYLLMLVPAFSQAVERISELGHGKPARVMLIKLLPGGHIKAHCDEGSYAEATDRLHLCVSTNEGCEFRCGDESVFAKMEELWWFDKSVEHEVWNRGDTPRVHLICDLWKA